MRSLLMIPLLMFAVPDRPNPNPMANETKSLAEQLQGQWQPVKGVVFGNAQPEMPKTDDYAVIDANRWIGMKDGKPTAETLTYTIDITKKPAAIDLVSKQGMMDFKFTGIFKIEGDTLTVCMSLNNGARPTEFVSTAQNQTILIEMRRKK